MYKFGSIPDTIFGLPIQHKVRDYNNISMYFNFLVLQDYDIKSLYITALKGVEDITDEEYLYSKELVLDMSFVDLIKNNIYGIKKPFLDLLNISFTNFNEDLFMDISSEDFTSLRQIIIDVNKLPYSQKNSNKEIARFDSLRGELSNITTSMETAYYSVWALIENPDGMTLYDFYSLFERLKVIKEYDTDTLWKTVDSKDKIKIHPWFADVKKEVELVSLDSLKRKTL